MGLVVFLLGSKEREKKCCWFFLIFVLLKLNKIDKKKYRGGELNEN